MHFNPLDAALHETARVDRNHKWACLDLDCDVFRRAASDIAHDRPVADVPVDARLGRQTGQLQTGIGAWRGHGTRARRQTSSRENPDDGQQEQPRTHSEDGNALLESVNPSAF